MKDHCKSSKNIEQGIENTNYYIETEKGKFILTVYEKRVDEKDLPFFMSVMKNLYDSKFPSPQPIINKNGNYITEILNKKAIYLYMRELTGLNTKQIVNCLNKMRKKYRTFKTKWDRGDT